METDPRFDEAHVGERSLGTLFRQLSHDLGTLLRQESELARVEMRTKAAKLGGSVAELGAGALVAFAGFQLLLVAVALALADAFDSAPLGALVVGASALAVGAGFVMRGRSRMKVDELAPTRTIDSLKKDAELAARGVHDFDPRGPAQRSV